jgi:hypothetical protein
MEETRNAFTDPVKKHKENRQLRKHQRRWEDNIKMVLREEVYKILSGVN